MTGPHRAGAPADGRAAPVRVMVRRLDPDLPAPGYAHPGDAGLDLQARTDLVLAPGDRALVPTGVAIALPEGYAAFTHPRSGLATRHGITLVNAPGTIDAGYRGEIKVCLINLDTAEPIRIRRGDRIAQLIVQRVELPDLVEVASFEDAGLMDTTRGAGGHGSSGGHSSL